MMGLPDRQENEFMSIKEIFPGAVEELPVGPGCQSSGEEDDAKDPQAYRPSTPVKRYRVRLAASTGSGPTAELEVSYGRLYPSETPCLLVDKVDNLAKEAWLELTRRVVDEVDQAAGQECVFQVCSAITELLRAYHDPSAEIPLYERMQRREAEEAKQKEEAARHDREEAQKKAMEDWEKRKQAERQRLERYEEKRRAVARVGDGGGTLDFLPEDSELGTGNKLPEEVPPPQKETHKEVLVNPKVTQDPREPVANADVSSRFKGGGRRRAPSDDSSECGTLPSFSDNLSLGAFEFVVDVKEDKPPAKEPQLVEKAAPVPKAKPKISPKMSPAAPQRPADRKLESASEAANSLAAVGRYATDFEELRFLGKGGFGFVTKARHRVDRQLYAVKRLELRGSAMDRERLLQECALLPRLTHLHIVRYYQAWIETEQVEPAPRPTAGVAQAPKRAAKKRAVRTVKPEVAAERDDWLSHNGPMRARGPSPPPGSVLQREFLYIQMEFCDGTTLREAIGSGALHKDEALIWKLFRQVLDALAYMHSRGLIHRDVKPPNIFLSKAEGGHAKLGDFGLSTELASLEPAGGDPTISGAARQQSTGVGTVLYMAPEVRGGRNLFSGSSLQLYDNRVDMFAMGVVFFEMWRPPFATAMERVDVLGKLVLPTTLSSEAIKDLANMPKEFLQKVQERLPEAPPEAAKILASLLQEDPEARFTADHLLNRSGLLPSGAFDPQVQRVLSALEDPSSSESVALLQALFSRVEEPAKDIPFFEQLFRFSEQGANFEAEVEVRDALLQLFREVCRRHGAVHDLCPLLRPSVRAESGALSPSSAVLSKGPSMPAAVRLVDAGNTLVELRANLTEPFIRALAALHGSRRAQGSVEDTEPLAAMSQQLRRYHVGTVYREAPSSELYAQSQFGHPREVSSAVVQFLWHPNPALEEDQEPFGPSPKSRHAISRTIQRNMSVLQEAEHLHMLAELFNSASMTGRVSLHLSDTRLLRLLQEVAYLRASREVHTGSAKKTAVPGAGKVPQLDDRAASTGERLRTRLLEALKVMATGEKHSSSQSGSSSGNASHVNSASATAPAVPHAALERAAGELAALLAGATGSQEAPKPPSAFLSEVEELYAVSSAPFGSPSSSQTVQSAGRPSAEPYAAAAEELSEVLRTLRALDSVISAQTTWRSISIEPYMPVNAMYGPGLVFSVKMYPLDKKEPTMVCVGGRVDHLARHFALLHTASSSDAALSESFALGAAAGSDDLCAVSSELAMDKLSSGLLQLAQGAGSTSSSKQRGKSSLPAFVPWWRQAGRQAACWPSILLGPASSEDGRLQAFQQATEANSLQLQVEALHAAAGLRRLGASCQLWPPGAGMIDARVVSEMQQNVASYALEGVCGPHDFIVTLVLHRKEERKAEEDDSAKKDGRKAEDDEDESTKRMVVVGTRFFLRALSDQGHEAMERAAKDAGGSSRSFDSRQSLLEFFERLSRRHAANASRVWASN